MKLSEFTPPGYGHSPATGQRHQITKRAAAALSLFVPPALLASSATVPSTLEGARDLAAGLAAATEATDRLAERYMLSAAHAGRVHAEAVAAWRDTATVRHCAPPSLAALAHRAEARAALLVAEIFGHRHDRGPACEWFRRAREAARTAARLGHPDGTAAEALVVAVYARHVLYAGAPARAENTAHFAWALALQGGNCTARALAPSVAARARAARAETQRARRALGEATGWMVDACGYPDVTDGPSQADPPMSALRHTRRAHAFTTAEVAALTGDLDRFEKSRANYLTGQPPSGPSVALLELARAWCLAASGDLDGAAEHACRTLDGVPLDGRTAPVTARAADLARHLRALDDEKPAVRRVREALDAFTAPLAEAV